MNAEELEFAEADRILAEHRKQGLVAPADGAGCYFGGPDQDILYQDRQVPELGVLREAPYSFEGTMQTFSGKTRSSGGVVWPASLRLAERVLAEPQRFAGRVLELGCGCGAVTVALARALGADSALVATDMDWPVLDNAEHNLRQVADRAVPTFLALLEWQAFVDGTPLEARALDSGGACPADFDLLVASEVVWGDLGPLVAAVLEKSGAPRFEIVAEADRDGFEHFLTEVERRGFTVTREELPDVTRGDDEPATFGCCRGTDAVLYSGRR